MLLLRKHALDTLLVKPDEVSRIENYYLKVVKLYFQISGFNQILNR